MKKIFLVLNYLILIGSMLSCRQKSEEVMNPSEIIEANGYAISVYDFDNFKALLEKKDDKIRVVNFWATWCKPCIEEMPYFELVNSAYADKNVEVILVSLDVPSQIESKLIPYLDRQNIKSKVLVLDDPDANSWIPKIDEDWSGAIPATYIFKNNKSKFYEKSFSYNDLEKELKLFVSP